MGSTEVDDHALFDSELFADFDLKSSVGKILKAHRAILASRCTVFHAMLTTDMQEAKSSFVDIADVDSETLRELLRFIYCKRVENLSEVASRLIFAAEKYQIKDLPAICGDSISSQLSIDNVCDSLMIADRIAGMDKLYRHCLYIMLE